MVAATTPFSCSFSHPPPLASVTSIIFSAVSFDDDDDDDVVVEVEVVVEVLQSALMARRGAPLEE